MVEVTISDIILFFAFFYSSLDIFIEWENFAGCAQPIQLWLLVSYAIIIVFRFSHYLGQYLSGEDNDEFLFLRGSRLPPKWVSFVILGVLFPFFVGWTTVGTLWFMQVQKLTPTCLPEGTQPWFFTFWLALCYVWIGVYIAFIVIGVVYAFRDRRMQRDLRRLEGPEVLRRWGRLRFLANYGIHFIARGLSPSQILKLPLKTLDHSQNSCCSICLDDLKAGDEVRYFYTCTHMFHRGCVDPWLLRSALCPNCKQVIANTGSDSACPSTIDTDRSERNSVIA
eukprot:Selendium_serpulae@DN6001_c0_g2_i1.p1